MHFFSRRPSSSPVSAPEAAGGGVAEAGGELLDHAVFVTGRGRSGSSLLLRLFDGHPQIYPIPRESRLLTEVAPAFRTSGDRAAVANFLTDHFAEYTGAAPAEAARRFDEGAARLDPASPTLARELVGVVLDALAAARDPAGARCFLEKTPKTEAHLDEVFASFPQARVIHLVRDPRAVYLSNKRSDAYRMEPDFAARQWVKSLGCILRQTTKFARGPQIQILRYEDLVGRPRETLADLCGFIGVEFDEALARPTVDGAPWRGNAYGDDAAATSEIEAAKAESWRDEITPEENRAIVAQARFEMSLLGYPLEAAR